MLGTGGYMNKERRIKKNKEFQEVFKKGRSFANRQFVIYVLKKKEQVEFRLGLSVSKKIGNAVTRNRVKRHVRQSFLELENRIMKGNDYIIVARKPTSELDIHESKASLIHVLKRAGVLKKL